LEFPDNPSSFDLIVPWNFQNKISTIPEQNNIVVFHSSDLPEGKGWAPIAHLFLNDIKKYTVTGFFISDEIDSGKMIIKASFQINDSMTARFLRKIDNILTIRLSIEIARNFNSKKFEGIQQPHVGSTTNPRRKPEQNEIRLKDTMESIVPKLRAAEVGHECYFILGESRYTVTAIPESISCEDTQIRIHYLSTGEIQDVPIQSLLSSSSLEI
jgi:methionyl-tRNA formyltransferase